MAQIKSNFTEEKGITNSLDQLKKLGELKPQDSSYINLGLRYAKQFSHKEFEVYFLLQKAKFEINNNNSPYSLEFSLQALQIIENNAEFNQYYDSKYNSKEDQQTRKYQSKTAMLLADALEYLKAYKEAIYYRKIHLNTIYNKPKLALEINNIIGSLYMKIEEYDSSKIYFSKALHLAKITEDDNSIAFCKNNTGLSFFKLNETKKAKDFFQKALPYYTSRKDHDGKVMEVVILQNITECLIKEQSWPNALSHINKAIKLSKTHQLNNLSGSSYYIKGNIKAKTNKLEISNRNLDSAITYLNKSNFYISQDLLIVYEATYKNYLALNNHRSANKYLEKYHTLYKSIYNQEQLKELSTNQSTYKILKIRNSLKIKQALNMDQQNQIAILQKDVVISKFKIIIIFTSSILLLFITVLTISRLKRKNKIEKLSNQLLSTINQNKSERLLESTLSLTRKKEFTLALKQRISDIKNIDSTEISSLLVFVENELQIDQSLLEMEKFISELSNEFFANLKITHSNLNDNEVKLSGLIRLNLTTKQIAIIKNITPESVKKYKNRLSKKLGLTTGTNLTNYLKSID